MTRKIMGLLGRGVRDIGSSLQSTARLLHLGMPMCISPPRIEDNQCVHCPTTDNPYKAPNWGGMMWIY